MCQYGIDCDYYKIKKIDSIIVSPSQERVNWDNSWYKKRFNLFILREKNKIKRELIAKEMECLKNENESVLVDVVKNTEDSDIWRKEGYNFARTINRFNEIPQSIDLIRQAIENIPERDIRTDVEISSGYDEWKNETSRGEALYLIENNGNTIIYFRNT